MNHLFRFEELRNVYYAFRHGESVANTEGKIVSSLARDSASYGLTRLGRIQVSRSIEGLVHQLSDRPEIQVVSSTFRRAWQTAKLITDFLGQNQLTSASLVRLHRHRFLNERYFGQFDGQLAINYRLVWAEDRIHPYHTQWGVESAEMVQTRMTAAVEYLEARSRNSIYLLVSHGDPLQILETAFRKLGPSYHRHLSPLALGAWRRLNLVS